VDTHGINALLNLETLLYIVGVVVYLLGLLAAISSARDGDWMPLLALVVLIGSSWVVAFLVPSGNIFGWVIMLLVLLVLHWLQVYRCPPRMTPCSSLTSARTPSDPHNIFLSF